MLAVNPATTALQHRNVLAKIGNVVAKPQFGCMKTNRLPALFLSHGSPMLALDDSPAGRFLDELGPALQRPRAVVVASAHFTAAIATLGAAAMPATMRDFGGFPDALHRLRYPAPGAPELATEIVERLEAEGLHARTDPQRGLDHGVWVPLKRMFPAADIPVLPLSVNPHADAASHLAIGRALAPLRNDNVLVIGSGGFVHNLGELDWPGVDHGASPAPMRDWAREFADWMRAKLLTGDLPALLEWEQQAPHAQRAHPTAEHLLPLFVALGAGGENPAVRTLHRSHEMGTLALDAFAFD